jgi:tetratricopeptide (TPR) repeat protein
LHLRGIINRDQGDLEQAVHDLNEALKLYENLKDQTHIPNATVDLGIVYYSQNKFAEAITTYRRVIILSEKIQDMRGVMIAHFNIGDINLQDEQYELAKKDLQIALEIAQKKKLAWMEALAGLDLVEAQIALFELDRAEQELNSLRPIVMKQSSPCLSGRELALMGSLHWYRRQTELAKDYFRRAFSLFESADCQEQQARAYLAFAGFMQEQGNFDQAKEALQQGKNIFVGLNNQLGLKAVEKAMLVIKNDHRTV